MTNKPVEFISTTAVTALALLASACTPSKEQTKSPLDISNSVAALSAKPKGQPSSLDLTRRYVGQTEFLTISSYFGRGGLESGQARSALPAEKSASDSGRRDVQESDVFKVGPDKMLYLLNSYRGLQVVDFKKGADKGELVGRIFPGTAGNFKEMYLDSKNQRIFVLSTNWSPSQVEVSSYDVSNPSELKAISNIKIEGNLSDSRLVGDVLYIATRSYKADESGKEKSSGIVTSLKLGASKVEQIQQVKLALAPDYDESMNIVETKVGEKYNYYLLAHLANSSWGLGRKSAVEVVDISSSAGKIQSLMTAHTSGSIVRRSSSYIKDGTLIVVSNYFTGRDSDDNQIGNNRSNRRLRVAVETFRLPNQNSKIIDAKEEKARKARLQYEIHRLEQAGLDAELLLQKTEEQLKNKDYGLAGLFVRSETGLQKLIADGRETVGSPDGQHAQIQDVRWNGNHLYVFWVPTNQIDPFELFDLSNVKEKAKHIARLQFDGWVAKAIPVSFAGKELVIGLGWIVPAVNNETNRRHLQAKIFEVQRIGKASIKELATLTADSSKFWANLQSGDKFIETNFKSSSKGEVLFEASTYDSTSGYRDGGKLIQFDLQAAVDGKESEALKEGAFLVGDSSWLRRIFTNSEINRVQAFSNQALNTFAASSTEESNGTLSAVQTLELARNIIGHVTFKQASQNLGVQIVANDKSKYLDQKYLTDGEVSLRLVDGNNSDAELSAVRSELKVKGAHRGHLKVGAQVLVYTSESEQDWNTRTNKSIHRFTLVQLDKDSKLSVLDQKEITQTRDERKEPQTENEKSALSRSIRNEYGRSPLLQIDDQVLVLAGDELMKINLTGGLNLAAIESTNCDVKEGSTASLKSSGSTSYLFIQESVQLPQDSELGKIGRIQVKKNYVSMIRSKEGKISCSDRTNIPGTPLVVTENQIISNDTEFKGIEMNQYVDQDEKGQDKRTEYKTVKTQMALSLVQMNQGQATLTDSIRSENNYSLTQIGEVIVRKVEAESQRFGRFSRPLFRPSLSEGEDSSDAKKAEFELIQASEGHLVTRTEYMNLEISNARIQGVVSLGQSRNAILVNSYSSNMGQLLELTESGLKAVAFKNGAGRSKDQIFVPGYGSKIQLDEVTNSLIISAGLYGNFQYFQ